MTDELTLITAQRREALALCGVDLKPYETGNGWWWEVEERPYGDSGGPTLEVALQQAEHFGHKYAGTLDACQRIVAERDALRAQLAARAEADKMAWALIELLAADNRMAGVLSLARDFYKSRLYDNARDWPDAVALLARRAKAAREGGAP